MIQGKIIAKAVRHIQELNAKDTNEVYRLAMKLGVIGIVGLLLLTGCSADTKPEYDPVELIEYEACLSQVIKGPYNEIPMWLEYCDDLKPIKK